MTDLAEAKELYTEAELAAVQAHIKRYFGDFQQSIKEYESPDICLEIAIIPPRPEHNYYTLATIGMGAHRMNVPETSRNWSGRSCLSICRRIGC